MIDLCCLRREKYLQQAEGYIELSLAEQAIQVMQQLDPREDADGRLSYLMGEGLRQLARYAEAIPFLKRAVSLLPDEIHGYLALAWCYKRTARVPLAIDALEQALEIEPGEAILHYNLACYWCLVQNRVVCLEHLEHALELDEQFRELIQDEPDFDPLRNDPEFQSLVGMIV